MKREKEGEELLDSNFSTDISNKTNKLIFANKKKIKTQQMNVKPWICLKELRIEQIMKVTRIDSWL